MNAGSWLSLSSLLAASLWLASLPATAQSFAVHPVDLSLGLIAQDEVNGDLALAKINSNDEALINLARGRSPDAAVPPNEILALLVDCANDDVLLAVWDTTAGNVLVVVADTEDLEGSLFVATKSGVPKSAAFVGFFDLNDNGSVQNSIDDGQLVIIGTVKLTADGCAESAKLELRGLLDVTITDDIGTQSMRVLVTKAKGKAGSPIDVFTP